MSFEFTLADEKILYRVVIANNGQIIVIDKDDDDVDIEAELALVELGFQLSLGAEILQIWGKIVEQLSELDAFDEMLEEIASSGEIRHRWRDAWAGEQPYVYEFDTDGLMEYLQQVFEVWLKDQDPDVCVLSKMIRAIRKKDRKPYIFDLTDDNWEEETLPESLRLLSCVERTLWADEIELSKWPEDFESEIFDPVHFDSEVNVDREQYFNVAASYELQEVIRVLGLTEKEGKLDEKAVEEAPKPRFPDPSTDPTAQYGVLYDYQKHIFDKSVATWRTERTLEVVPYDMHREAQEAFALSMNYIDDREGSVDADYHRIEIVRRLSAIDALRDLPEPCLEDMSRAEALVHVRQIPMFDQSVLDEPPVSPFPSDINVWVPLEEDDDDE